MLDSITKNNKLLWWLIQINAVMWFITIGVVLSPDSPSSYVASIFLGTFVAALLEFIIYKRQKNNETNGV